jgi:predicted membrane-bound spermidine synthase
MGQWGWVMGLNVDELSPDRLKEELLTLDFKSVETRFLDQNAMAGMVSFGKDMYEDFDSITPSNHNNLKVFWYYKNKAWEIY